ncbi:MAG TPA: carboxylesterase family protein [Chitinophagales bacterium]|nr:carboxylesterase family protein [Chitinophagales bacterium]
MSLRFLQCVQWCCYALLLGIIVPFSLSAQPSCTNNRYKNEIFEVQKTSWIKYGTATAVVYPPYVSELATYQKDLYLDLYQPVGDTLRKRPTIVMVYGGAFLVGSTLQPELVDFCNAMARRGYVVAAIDYRLGYNSLDNNTAIRAVYRAAQDLKAAIRYLKANASTYKIDTSLVFAGGNSAGGVTSLHAAYVNETERANSDLLEATYGGGLLGNWSDLGCTECSGNNYGLSPYNISGVPDLVINLWGAIGDTIFMKAASDAPVISFHGTSDDIVNPNYGSPFGYPVISPLYGSIPIHERANHLGMRNEIHIYDGGHELWIDGGIATEIKNYSVAFMYQFMKPNTPTIQAATNVCANGFSSYSTPITAGVGYCWSVVGGTIVGSANSATVTVQWGNAGGTLYLRTINKNLVESDATTLVVSPPSCGIPISLSVNNLTNTSARLDWAVVNGANSYTIQARKVGTTTWTSLSANSNSKQLGNVLQSCKQYEWRVRANCSTGSCGYSAIHTFTTIGCSNGGKTALDDTTTPNDLTAFSLSPNPAQNEVLLQYFSENEQDVLVSCWQSNGQMVQQYHHTAATGDNEWLMSLSDLPNGIYWVTLETKQAAPVRQKLLIAR